MKFLRNKITKVIFAYSAGHENKLDIEVIEMPDIPAKEITKEEKNNNNDVDKKSILLDDMNKKELLEFAEKNDIKVDSRMSRDNIFRTLSKCL